MSDSLDLVKKSIKYHGIFDTFYKSALKTINKVVYVHVLVCVSISKVRQSSLEIDPKFEHGFLDKDQLLNFSMDKENELPQDFLSLAIAQKDECYAITENGNLAAFGWYSNKATLTDVQQLLFCFDPLYVYMYKGFTKNNYRGQRLHAAAMSFALKHYLENGSKGIVSYVDSTNFDSLKSCWRMGYEKIGAIYVLKIFGKVFHYSSRSCKKYGISLKPEIS